MRRASSAPDLSSLPEAPHPLAKRKPQSASSSALSKLAARPSDAQREGRLRTRALPAALEAVHLPEPPQVQLVAPIAAESARGLVGLECYQLYGAGLEAPPLGSPPAGGASPGQPDSSRAAFASCIATPATGEERNLGEMVESEARALMKASQERVAARFESEVRLSQGLVLEEVAAAEERERRELARRKRRLAELLREGLVGGDGRRAPGEPFPECAEARRALEALRCRAGGANRLELPDNYICIGDICFPTETVDQAIFCTSPPEAPGLSA